MPFSLLSLAQSQAVVISIHGKIESMLLRTVCLALQNPLQTFHSVWTAALEVVIASLLHEDTHSSQRLELPERLNMVAQAGLSKPQLCLMRRTDSLEKTLMLGKIEGRRRGRQRMRWLDGVTDSIDMSFE